MSGQVQVWILALHVVGVIIWVGAMFGLAQILTAHAGAGGEAGKVFAALERKTARVMDVGAAIAIAGAIAFLLATRDLGPDWALKKGWLHVKLVLVLLLLGCHGFLRARAGRASRGEPAAPPRALHAVLGLVVAAIVGLAVAKPF